MAQLRLVIHAHAQPRPVTEGIPFLGFVQYPHKRLLKRRKGIAYQRTYKQLIRQYQQKNLPFEQLDASVQGWINHVCYGNTTGLRKKLFRHVIAYTSS